MLLSGHLEVLGPPPPPGHEEHEDPDIERHGEADEDHGPAGNTGHQVTAVTCAHRGLVLQYNCTENQFTVQVTVQVYRKPVYRTGDWTSGV